MSLRMTKYYNVPGTTQPWGSESDAYNVLIQLGDWHDCAFALPQQAWCRWIHRIQEIAGCV